MSTSWVIVDKATGKPVMETFNRRIADAVRRDRFDVWPIGKWLASLNFLHGNSRGDLSGWKSCDFTMAPE